MPNLRILLTILPFFIASTLTLPTLHQRDDDVEYVYWFDYLFLPQHLENSLARYFLEVHSTDASQPWSYECSGGYAQGVYGDQPMQCQMKVGPAQPQLTVTISLPHAVSSLPSDENTFFTVRNAIEDKYKTAMFTIGFSSLLTCSRETVGKLRIKPYANDIGPPGFESGGEQWRVRKMPVPRVSGD